MDWSEVVATILGGILAIAGGFASQWWSEKKAAAREEREQVHEREVWARGLRYEAHVSFLSEYDRKYQVLSDAHEFSSSGPDEPPEDYLASLWDRREAVRLVCTRGTADAGEKAWQAMFDFAFRSGRWEAVNFERDRYLAAVRDEFGLAAVPIMGD